MEYEIEISTARRQRLIQLNGEAEASGRGPAFRTALRSLQQRLRTNPHGVGEILYHLNLGQPVHLGVERPASIRFAIYDNERLVWITEISLLG